MSPIPQSDAFYLIFTGFIMGGAVAAGIARGLMATIDPDPPCCPYCGRRLRPVVVADLAAPPPGEARWYCYGNGLTWQRCFARMVYFAGREADDAKPDAAELREV